MAPIKAGDKVRIDIPDTTDPDHDRLHGEMGTVVEVVEDDLGGVTGDSRDSYKFRVRLDDDEVVNTRWVDLRPV